MKKIFLHILEGFSSEQLFWMSLLFFVLDNVVNYFIHIPIFVAYGFVLVPWLILLLYRQGTLSGIGAWLSVWLLVAAGVGVIRFGLSAKNISDLLFLELFVLSWLFYIDKPAISLRSVQLFFIISTVLFAFTFTGADRFDYSQDKVARRAFDETARAQGKGRDYLTWQPPRERRESFEKHPMKLKEQWNLSYEVFREYHKGLFRVPHVASYFFAFLAFYFVRARLSGEGGFSTLLPALLAMGSCLYTGSRTILFAFIGAFLISLLFSRRWRWMILAVGGAGLLFLYSLHPLMRIFQNTVLFQYLVTFDTLLNDPGQFSRIKIWMSWWQEIREFAIMDFLFGRTPLMAMEANFRNLGTSIWFHNDFLQVAYAYGAVALLLFMLFWVNAYRDTTVSSGRQMLPRLCFLMMFLAAVFNGFYLYFPVLLWPLLLAFRAPSMDRVAA